MPVTVECFSDRSFPAAVVVFAGRCGRSRGGRPVRRVGGERRLKSCRMTLVDAGIRSASDGAVNRRVVGNFVWMVSDESSARVPSWMRLPAKNSAGVR